MKIVIKRKIKIIKKFKNLLKLKKRLIKNILVIPKQNKYIPTIYSVPNGLIICHKHDCSLLNFQKNQYQK